MNIWTSVIPESFFYIEAMIMSSIIWIQNNRPKINYYTVFSCLPTVLFLRYSPLGIFFHVLLTGGNGVHLLPFCQSGVSRCLKCARDFILCSYFIRLYFLPIYSVWRPCTATRGLITPLRVVEDCWSNKYSIRLNDLFLRTISTVIHMKCDKKQ